MICFNMDKKLRDNSGFDNKVYYSGGRLWMDFNLTLSFMTLGKTQVDSIYLPVDTIIKKVTIINAGGTE